MPTPTTITVPAHMSAGHSTSTRQSWTTATPRNHIEVAELIEALEAEHGGAWGYDEVFGTITIHRATTPSRLPDELTSLHGSPRTLLWQGTWQKFSEATIIREQQRGLLAD